MYKAHDYTSLLGLKGFSTPLLKNHFALYEGYVKNANKLLEMLPELSVEGHGAEPGFTEVRRRLSFELNGIKLHEYYFENMCKEGAEEPDKDSEFYAALTEEFGSYKNWKKSFKDTASLRGVGWTVAVYDPRVGRMIHTWIDEHHMGNVAGTFPLLVLDLWEHAMLLDYGSDRAKYIDAFFDVIDWTAVSARFLKAAEMREVYHQV